MLSKKTSGQAHDEQFRGFCQPAVLEDICLNEIKLPLNFETVAGQGGVISA